MKISEYFNSVKEAAVGGAQIAVTKTKEIASTTKANIAIRGEEEKIKKAQLELGKLFYKDYIVGEEPDMAEYLPWCEKISDSKISIEDLKIAIEDLKASGKVEEVVVELVTEEETCECGCGHDHHHHEHHHEEGCSCGCHDHDHEEVATKVVEGDRPMHADRDCGFAELAEEDEVAPVNDHDVVIKEFDHSAL
ncbi:MAG: hypothetical protein R3Y62_04570 [Eubacteriales bacterium]